MMVEVPAKDGSLVMKHVPTCQCRSASTKNGLKLIDTRCIAGYLVPKEN